MVHKNSWLVISKGLVLDTFVNPVRNTIVNSSRSASVGESELLRLFASSPSQVNVVHVDIDVGVVCRSPLYKLQWNTIPICISYRPAFFCFQIYDMVVSKECVSVQLKINKLSPCFTQLSLLVVILLQLLKNVKLPFGSYGQASNIGDLLRVHTQMNFLISEK